MLEIQYESSLGFYNEDGILTISAKQYDTARKFIFEVLNNGLVYEFDEGDKVYLRVLKADGKQFESEGCCYIENNKIIVDPSLENGNQLLTAEGINKCELHFVDANEEKQLTTWTFNILVQGRVHDGSHIVSEDSFDLLDSIRKEEFIRKTNEETRLQNENVRIDAENERISNELTRIDNENIRANAETARIEAENIRVENEVLRQENESQRNQKTEESIQQIQEFIDNGNTVIEHANEATEYAIEVGRDLETMRDRGDFKGEKGDQGVPGISMEGTFAFEIDETGHLLIYYNDNTIPPQIMIDDDGHLIYNID